MPTRQNSEKIFLQPIDQHYSTFKPKESPEEVDQTKFFDDYTHGVINCLNISTDSETWSNSFDLDVGDNKLTEHLAEDWKNNIDLFKTYQLSVMRSYVLQRMNYYRNALNVQISQTNSNRSLSCYASVNKMEIKPVNPFKMASPEVSTLDDGTLNDGLKFSGNLSFLEN
jgi:hypothetical protein